MSFIPDYRSDKNMAYLTAEDQAFIRGFHLAIDVARGFFTDVLEIPMTDDIMIRFELGSAAGKSLETDFCTRMDAEEKEIVCFIFEGAEYIPEDVELEIKGCFVDGDEDDQV